MNRTVDVRVRANARLLSTGRVTIDEVNPEESRVSVYVYAIGFYDYPLADVDTRYLEQVKTELGIK